MVLRCGKVVGGGETNEVDVVVGSKRHRWVIAMWIMVEGWEGELELWCLNENAFLCVFEAGRVVIATL